MKKTALVLIVLLAAASPAFAREKKSLSGGGVSVSSATHASGAPVTDDAKRAEMKKKVEEKKKDLNGSEWKVALTSGVTAAGEDTLTFQNGQVASKMFGDKGFPSSNYTISVPEGADMATWETMQTNPKGGVLFIRGEWKEGVMRGIMSQQLEEGKTKDYNFSSASKVAVSPTTEKPTVLATPESAPDKAKVTAEESQEKADYGDVSKVEPFTPGTTEEKR